MGPAKKHQEKTPEERAKQSGSLKKASNLLFSSDEEVLRSGFVENTYWALCYIKL